MSNPCVFKNLILQKVCLISHYRCYYLGFGGHYTVFSYFVYIMYLFAITAIFLSFPDKNHWFSSQRRREGVVGDANDN